jgi:hypothetical protein
MTDPKPLHVYIAGPMSTVGNYNFPLFDYVCDRLRKTGCVVFNPAEHAREKIGSLETIKKMDKAELEYAIRHELFPEQVAWICRHANVVMMLPGWEQSEGSKIERAIGLYFQKEVREAPNIVLEVDVSAK